MQNWPFLYLLLIISSCSHEEAWKLDAIASRENRFNAARLHCQANASPLRFAINRTDKHLEGCLTLSHFRFSPSKENPSLVKAIFYLQGEKKEEWLPFLEGGMKLSLSKEITHEIIETLQKGKKPLSWWMVLNPFYLRRTFQNFTKS